MKTLPKFAAAFFTGLLGLPLQTALPATTGVQLSWITALASEGQFRFLDTQPKQDPFQGMGSAQNLQVGNDKNSEARDYLRRGRDALAQGNLEGASYFRDRAAALNVTFGLEEDTPAKLTADIRRQAGQAGTAAPAANNPVAVPVTSSVVGGPVPTMGESGAYPSTGPRYAALQNTSGPAASLSRTPDPMQQDGVVQPAGQLGFVDQSARQAVYDPAQDTSYNKQAVVSVPEPNSGQLRFTAEQPPATGAMPSAVVPVAATAPLNHTPAQAPLVYEPPFQNSNVRQAQALAPAPSPAVLPPSFPNPPSPGVPNVLANPAPDVALGDQQLLIETTEAQQRLQRQVAAEVARQSRQALDLRDSDPMGAIGKLKQTRAMVEQSNVGSDDKKLMLSRVDRMLGELEKYVDQHRAEIELDQQNRAVKKDIQKASEYKVEVQQRLATLVEEYNKLRNEERFYEAEAKAKEARQLAPDEPVVTQMWEEIKFYRRVVNNRRLEDEKESGVWQALYNVEESGIPFDDNNPIVFGDKAEWEALSARRKKFAGDGSRVRHPAEIEIEKKLTTPVSLKFKDAPLGEVINHLKTVADVNIYMDPQGLAEEGVHPSTTVTIDLSQEISLRSALTLILQPLNLNYVIKNEVLKITSEQLRDRTVYPRTYNVADLVIPIPDFVPHDQLGLPTALARGYDTTNRNLAGAAGFQPPVISVAQQTGAGIATPERTLAQNTSGFANPGRPGGTAQADFDALIELITKTIEPDSWDEVGGPGSVAEFETNLSLVISQTQEVHEKIADLLDQLRRLQDLQVTIEVRFITLTDNFFEQIGIDFDFNIDDNVRNLRFDDSGRSNTLGLGFSGGLPSGTLAPPGPLTIIDPGTGLPLNIGVNDIQVRQNSFLTAAPAFGGFDPASATTFGVAILSDIEAYFLVRAAQGDTRSNVMQSPKVTLFNGQAASISDQIQQPFVTSVTPVVGDFAAAQAPVIVVLAEGTTLSVQAVVSPDRRFVRLTLVPFFSEIRDVDEFTFTGSTTSTAARSDTNEEGTDTTSSVAAQENTTFTEGTTIQLPTFAFTTVTTTVSVPDGGTVLLGGIKRLREGRNELGTPFLNKLPYISRLFKNVGVGRETQSLMLMVTPRIIIQEEEEEKLGLALP